MSDHLHDWLAHTQPNVHGGEDILGHDGVRMGYSMPAADGGQDVYDSHGAHALHVSSNVHGGHTVTDALGHPVVHGFGRAGGGEDLYGGDGHHIGHLDHGSQSMTLHDTQGHFQSWRANVFGGMSADPLSNMRTLRFPPFGG